MKMYEIIDEYGYDDYEYLDTVIEHVINKFKIKDSIFDIIFIDDDKMHEMNLSYRGIDRTTDVLSFALNDNKHIDAIVNSLGDIFISIPKMKSQASDYGHSEKRELSFLVVHGMLHLLGYDHMNESDEKEMFDLQNEILNDLNIIK